MGHLDCLRRDTLTGQALLTLTLLVLLLHTTAASESQVVTISYHSHYPVASEKPNACEVAFCSEPRNVTYTPGQYIPFIGEVSCQH